MLEKEKKIIFASEISLEGHINTIKQNEGKIISIEEKIKKSHLLYEVNRYYENKLSLLYRRNKKYNIDKEIIEEYKRVLKDIVKNAKNLTDLKRFEETNIFLKVKDYR